MRGSQEIIDNVVSRLMLSSLPVEAFSVGVKFSYEVAFPDCKDMGVPTRHFFKD